MIIFPYFVYKCFGFIKLLVFCNFPVGENCFKKRIFIKKLLLKDFYNLSIIREMDINLGGDNNLSLSHLELPLLFLRQLILLPVQGHLLLFLIGLFLLLVILVISRVGCQKRRIVAALYLSASQLLLCLH